MLDWTAFGESREEDDGLYDESEVMHGFFALALMCMYSVFGSSMWKVIQSVLLECKRFTYPRYLLSSPRISYLRTDK